MNVDYIKNFNDIKVGDIIEGFEKLKLKEALVGLIISSKGITAFTIYAPAYFKLISF